MELICFCVCSLWLCCLNYTFAVLYLMIANVVIAHDSPYHTCTITSWHLRSLPRTIKRLTPEGTVPKPKIEAVDTCIGAYTHFEPPYFAFSILCTASILCPHTLRHCTWRPTLCATILCVLINATLCMATAPN